MPEANTVMDIYKLLNRSNCRKCNEVTCLAFAAAVYKKKRSPKECPYLDGDPKTCEAKDGAEPDLEKMLKALKQAARETDLARKAETTGGFYAEGRLNFKILGKKFSIDSDGKISTDIHVNSWILPPIYDYIFHGAGLEATGNWIPFRELENGRPREGLFLQRGERPLKRIADLNTDLFGHLIEIFDGKKVENDYGSDISLVLYPFPKFPVLICYWKPEDGIDSSLNFYFDRNAGKNLRTESIYILITGFVYMIEKISINHGWRR